MLQEWSEPLASPGPVQVSFAYGGFGGLLFPGTMAAWMGFYMLHPLPNNPHSEPLLGCHRAPSETPHANRPR